MVSNPIQWHSLRGVLRFALTDREMQRRLVITGLLLFIVNAASYLPLPGVDKKALSNLFDQLALGKYGLSALDFLTRPGAMRHMSLFNLGLAPFFSACLWLQLASVVIPTLKRHSFGGEHGRAAIARMTYLLTVILCLVWSYFGSLHVEKLDAGLSTKWATSSILTIHGGTFQVVAMVSMTAATLLLLYIGGLITEYGIGNGVALIAIVDLDFPTKLYLAGRDMFIWSGQNQELQGLIITFLVVFFIGVVWLMYFITTRVKAVKIEHDGRNSTIPLRPGMVGKVPLAWAMSVVYLPISLAAFIKIPWLKELGIKLGAHSIVFTMLLIMLIVVFTYVYALIVFNARLVEDLTRRYGYSLIRNNRTSGRQILDVEKRKVLVITSLVLIGATLTPLFASAWLKIPPRVGGVLGGIHLIIFIGVLADVVSHLGFYKNKNESSTKDWSISYIAFDEIEATVKSEFLKSNGIPALVEPLRFTWGMPIRTIVDQYRIYVPLSKRDEARGLIV